MDPITFTFNENSNYGWERCKCETLLDVVNKLQKVCWQCPTMFCLYTSSKLSRHNLNFHLIRVKVMRSNTGYLLKSSLLYIIKLSLKITVSVAKKIQMRLYIDFWPHHCGGNIYYLYTVVVCKKYLKLNFFCVYAFCPMMSRCQKSC